MLLSLQHIGYYYFTVSGIDSTVLIILNALLPPLLLLIIMTKIGEGGESQYILPIRASLVPYTTPTPMTTTQICIVKFLFIFGKLTKMNRPSKP